MILGKYNQAKTITFDLVAPDGVDLIINATFASGDIVIMKDEGAEANTTNLPTDEGTGYSLVLTATEMTAARIRLYIIDQTGTKIWLDISIGLETYGNASAEHAFDLDAANVTLAAVTHAGAVVPTVSTLTGHTPQTGDNFTRLGAPVGASLSADVAAVKTDTAAILVDTADIQPKIGTPVTDVSADIAAIQADTDDIQTRLPAALVGGLMSSDVTAISTDTIAADNLELQYDATGLSGDTFPATQAQVGNLATGSAAISVSAESSTLTVGTEVGTFADTEALDGSYHEISDVGGALDIYYQFDVGGSGVGVDVTFFGRLNGQNDSIVIEAFDWVGAVWTQIGTLPGINGTTDAQGIYSLLAKHTGDGANLGKIRVRGFAASGLTTATLFLDQVFASFSVVNQSVGYSGGQVWVDTVEGIAGTESFINGVADNPVLTLVDAVIIAGNLNLHQYRLSSDTSISLVTALTNSVITSIGASIDFNGQDVSGSLFSGIIANGIALNSTAEFDIRNSTVNDITINDGHLVNCSLAGMITFGTVAANILITDSHSKLPAGIAPVINFGTTAVNHNLTMAQFFNDLEIQNYNVVGGGVDTFHLTGVGSLTINANCDGGTIHIRGKWKITDNSGGAVTLIYDDDTTNINSILVDTNEIQGDWTNGGRLDLLLDQLITQIDTATSEPAQGSPPVSAKMALKIDYLYKWMRNRSTSTATTISMFADDATTVDHKSPHSDDGITYDRGEIITGP
jgi:hypothetical protein